MTGTDIISFLPYSEPFLFVSELLEISEHGIQGTYTFSGEADFYKGHFKNHPITPGVLLTECCAQIGLVSLGIYLLRGETDLDRNTLKIGLSSSEMEFLLPVFPNEKVTVTSKIIYFRFHKLKCKVQMHDSQGKLVCQGVLAGMLKHEADA